MPEGVLFLWFLTLLFWGSSPLLEKFALQAVDPWLALTLRTGFAALVLLGVSLGTGKFAQVSLLGWRDTLALLGSGLLAGVLGMFTYFSLLKSGAASKIVPLTAAYPLVTALLAYLFLGEKISLTRLLGIVLTILGLIILQRS